MDAQAGKTHLRLCALASDRDERIKGWHIKPDAEGNWYIESPEKVKVLVVRIEDGQVYLIQNGEKVAVI